MNSIYFNIKYLNVDECRELFDRFIVFKKRWMTLVLFPSFVCHVCPFRCSSQAAGESRQVLDLLQRLFRALEIATLQPCRGDVGQSPALRHHLLQLIPHLLHLLKSTSRQVETIRAALFLARLGREKSDHFRGVDLSRRGKKKDLRLYVVRWSSVSLNLSSSDSSRV